MAAILAKDPATNQVYSFTDTGSLDNAIGNYHYIPVDSAGVPYVVQNFEGGHLLNGAPENTYLFGVWYAGQKELLQTYWQKGQIPTPAADILNLPVVPMPGDVAASYQQYEVAQASAPTIPTWLWLVAGAGALYFLGAFDRGKRAES